MPKYKKKITNLMDYADFSRRVENVRIISRGKEQPLLEFQKAFLTVLFFSGCRISEALALTGADIHCTQDAIFVQFFRLKGSKQTDPTELPRADALLWLCGQEGRLFPFCRMTGYRLVKKVFPILYPHYFRMNRITKTSDKFGDTTVYRVFGICAQSIDHYRGKVDIKRVGQALKDELKE